MYKTILCGLVILIFSYAELHAGADVREGFIITAGKDTIFGKIDYRSDLNNGKLCIFTTASGTKEYSPAQILGYGFINDRFFSSNIIEGTFVEVLVAGELSLYKSVHTLYVRKTGNELYPLESKQVRDTAKVNVTGGVAEITGYRADIKWKGTLSFLTSDCIESYQALQRLRLDDKSIIKFVIDYNLCKGAGFKYYKVTRPRFRIDYGISAGMASSSLKLKNLPSQFNYLDKSYQSYQPLAGLIFAVSSPRISERLALQMELYYLRTSYYSQMVEDQSPVTTYYETNIDFSTLSVPLSLRYTLPVGKSSLFFNAGAELAFITDNNSRVNKEILTGNIVETYVDEPFLLNNSPVGYWGDIGFLKSFKSFRIGATLKYYQTGNIISNEELTSSLNRISLSIILLGK